MREKLDSKLLLDMMLEIREKSKGNQSIEGKHVIREFVQRLQPFYGAGASQASWKKGSQDVYGP